MRREGMLSYFKGKRDADPHDIRVIEASIAELKQDIAELEKQNKEDNKCRQS